MSTKERPILFSAPMVRALLAGTKTQTRRVVKLPEGVAHADASLDRMQDGYPDGVRPVWEIDGDPNACSTRCPYGQPGDRLWVREAWRITGESPEDTLDMFDRDDVQYRADDDQSYIDKYRPSIHMPRRFSRITLEVTAVRVERLQDISETDAMAEGVTPKWEPGCSGRLMEAFRGFSFRPAASAYADLWEQINGPGSWDANPWVWVVEFKRAA